tara:strand:- start:47 stop:352 length:306 start_codon:yes stop_codon:yes gene_type:complete
MMNEIRTDEEYRTQMADLIREEMVTYIQDGARLALGTGKPDLQHWDMIVNDADDLRIVHSRIDRDEIPFAFNKACDLDTAVRDVIPQKVWNWMAKVHAASK